jgi:hypothetical protein
MKTNRVWNEERFRTRDENRSEWVTKLSNARKGKIPWNKGLSQSDDTRQKISIANKGNIAHNKGKKHSDVTRQKMSVWQQQRINLVYFCIGKTFFSVADRDFFVILCCFNRNLVICHC